MDNEIASIGMTNSGGATPLLASNFKFDIMYDIEITYLEIADCDTTGIRIKVTSTEEAPEPYEATFQNYERETTDEEEWYEPSEWSNQTVKATVGWDFIETYNKIHDLHYVIPAGTI